MLELIPSSIPISVEMANAIRLLGTGDYVIAHKRHVPKLLMEVIPLDERRGETRLPVSSVPNPVATGEGQRPGNVAELPDSQTHPEPRRDTRNALLAGENPASSTLSVGDEVEKTGGDYTFHGIIVAAFQKLGGAVRYVVEDPRGILHIYSAKNLRRVST